MIGVGETERSGLTAFVVSGRYLAFKTKVRIHCQRKDKDTDKPKKVILGLGPLKAIKFLSLPSNQGCGSGGGSGTFGQPLPHSWKG